MRANLAGTISVIFGLGRARQKKHHDSSDSARGLRHVFERLEGLVELDVRAPSQRAFRALDDDRAEDHLRDMPVSGSTLQREATDTG